MLYISSNYRLSDEDKELLVENTQYYTEYETAQYARGKMYTYETPVPYVGLVVTIACNGYNNGTSTSYIITKIYKNKKGEVKKADIAVVYSYNDESKTLTYIDSKYKPQISQSGNKDGTWVLTGDKSDHMIYYVSFGRVQTYDPGFMK